LALDLNVNSMDIPFGKAFRVQERIELHQTSGAIEVKKLYRNNFVQNVGFFSSVISAATGVEQGKSFPALLATLESRADANTEESSDTSTSLQIWELQRRSSFFNTDWQAPFWKQDDSARWRWVDSSYQKHPWTRPSDPGVAASAMTPPVTPDRSWMPLNEWSVSKQRGDQDGWQYAVDFLKDDLWWTSKCFGQPLRRRLWTRQFAKVASSQQAGLTCQPPDLRAKAAKVLSCRAIFLGAGAATSALCAAAVTLHHVF